VADLDSALAKLDSPKWDVRVEAVRELRRYQDARAFTGIVKALYDPGNEAVTIAAVEVLLSLATPEAADALFDALRSDNEEIVESVAMCLEWSDSPWAATILARDEGLLGD
jgi:HEAT repeat protein